jgi:hypothetical protein
MVRVLPSFQALGIDGLLPAVTDNCSGGVDGRLYCVCAAGQGDTGRLYRPVSIQFIAHPVICIALQKKNKKKFLPWSRRKSSHLRSELWPLGSRSHTRTRHQSYTESELRMRLS